MLLAAVFSSVFCAASQIITEVETEEISRLSVAMEASEAEAVITLVSALDFVSTSFFRIQHHFLQPRHSQVAQLHALQQSEQLQSVVPGMISSEELSLDVALAKVLFQVPM